MTHEMSAEEFRWWIAPENEADFTRIVISAATERQWLAYHTHDSRRSQAGFPDLVVVHPEHGAIYAELKMPEKYPTPMQRVWLTTLLRAGHRVYLWRPADYRRIVEVLDGARHPGYEAVAEQRRKRDAPGSIDATNRNQVSN